MAMMMKKAVTLLLTALALAGCKGEAPAKVLTLTLDWKPEPEFGGFYAAQLNGAFARQGLTVELKSAGEGAPTWQLVATGKTPFATTAADQVLIARAQGADVVALFAVYQTSPQAIMTHRARGFSKIEDVFASPGTLAAESNAWLKFLRAKFPEPQVKLTGYAGGVSTFLAKPDYSQQCFVFSEPVIAKRQGADPQTFLVADAGYNPYTTVVIAKGDYVRANPEAAKKLVAACREGWRAYLDDPRPANEHMAKLNTSMDPQTFADGAVAQKPLIENEETRRAGLGTMSAARWEALGQQLVDLKVIEKAPPARECFWAVD